MVNKNKSQAVVKERAAEIKSKHKIYGVVNVIFFIIGCCLILYSIIVNNSIVLVDLKTIWALFFISAALILTLSDRIQKRRLLKRNEMGNVQLIKCSACNKQISAQAESCPACGQITELSLKRRVKKRILITELVIIIIIVLGIVGYFSYSYYRNVEQIRKAVAPTPQEAESQLKEALEMWK